MNSTTFFTLLKWGKELLSKLRGNSDYPEMQGRSETEVLIIWSMEEVRELTGPYNINLENGQSDSRLDFGLCC